MSPSVFYRLEVWRLGMALARRAPPGTLGSFCRRIAGLYWVTHPTRRAVVCANLLPVCDGDAARARRTARSLFDQFALKLADLWRWESGAQTDLGLVGMQGWEHFERAQERGRGVLLVTPHLGNWEWGGAIMLRRGVKLLVLSLEEPDPRLTQLRRESRLQQGIETLVIGRDAFAFVEIIRRLEAGATVALLMDRPPARSAVTVEFCGRAFQASVAAAELARASGCAVVGVHVLRESTGYVSIVLPEFKVDRRSLGNREARVAFTQQILRAFEPVIRQHPDQWYHFVPIWPDGGSALPPPGAASSNS